MNVSLYNKKYNISQAKKLYYSVYLLVYFNLSTCKFNITLTTINFENMICSKTPEIYKMLHNYQLYKIETILRAIYCVQHPWVVYLFFKQFFISFIL